MVHCPTQRRQSYLKELINAVPDNSIRIGSGAIIFVSLGYNKTPALENTFFATTCLRLGGWGRGWGVVVEVLDFLL